MRKFIFILLFIFGCSPAWHLQKAIEKGGEVKSDTAKINVTFKVRGPETSIDLASIFKVPKEQIRYIVKDTVIFKDSIRIEWRDGEQIIKCPDKEETKTVPCVTTTTISAGYTKLQLIGSTFGGILFVSLMAYGAYRLAGVIKAGKG